MDAGFSKSCRTEVWGRRNVQAMLGTGGIRAGREDDVQDSLEGAGAPGSYVGLGHGGGVLEVSGCCADTRYPWKRSHNSPSRALGRPDAVTSCITSTTQKAYRDICR